MIKIILVFIFHSSSLVPPSVLVNPKQALVYEDDATFTANCTANGYPKPFIRWMTTHKAQSIETSKDGSTLILRKPKTKDSGTYKCVAENIGGTAYGFLFVVVIKGNIPCIDFNAYLNDCGCYNVLAFACCRYQK